MMTDTSITIAVSPELARRLPDNAEELAKVLELGLKSWRVEQAIAAFRNGQGTLAYAAEQAGIPLREMIVLAHAHGLEPKVDWESEARPLSLDQASGL